MSCTCTIPRITEAPFHICRGEEVCLVCGSARTNEFWACPTCRPLKKVVQSPWDGRHDGPDRRRLRR